MTGIKYKEPGDYPIKITGVDETSKHNFVYKAKCAIMTFRWNEELYIINNSSISYLALEYYSQVKLVFSLHYLSGRVRRYT